MQWPPTRPGRKRREIPLGAGRLQHFQRVYAQFVEQFGQVVHQRDIQVALGVFDHLGRFGHLQRAGPVRTRGDDGAVQPVHKIGHLGGGAGSHLEDAGDPVLLVTGVDAFGDVTGEEIVVVTQARHFFEDRNAHFLGTARIHGGFVDHDVAGLDDLAQRFTGLDQGRPDQAAWPRVDRGRHGDDVEHSSPRMCRPARGAETQPPGGGQFIGIHLQRDVPCRRAIARRAWH